MGFGVVILPDLSRGIGPRSVEISQPRRLQAIGSSEINHHALAGELGETVGVDRIEPGRLGNWEMFRLAMDGVARRENYVSNPRAQQWPQVRRAFH